MAVSNPSNQRIGVRFQSIDASGLVVLRYSGILIKASLAGIHLKKGASGVLGMLLPDGISVTAEIVQKGTIPSVILWKGTTNLNQELLLQGVAQVIR
ncbi:hypothetical protein MF271_23435 (plasmid) [Deinococcus sp. KNUC1210]|uniref:hypothetical protein n=1 Tax=Deinococcus sp. KNUC1210 TaxID=2917691 RepID=UPI001EF00D4B|nr:hypothetical protein [Deinococcus sp. KNUC1210]ULH17926.1 hypothetical protein MF271_23435 [Deinococcus sp. KNUC1210]